MEVGVVLVCGPLMAFIAWTERHAARMAGRRPIGGDDDHRRRDEVKDLQRRQSCPLIVATGPHSDRGGSGRFLPFTLFPFPHQDLGGVKRCMSRNMRPYDYHALMRRFRMHCNSLVARKLDVCTTRPWH